MSDLYTISLTAADRDRLEQLLDGARQAADRDECRQFCRRLLKKLAAAMPSETGAVRVELASRGGKASAESLTPEQRRERAKKAARARWREAQKGC